MTIAILIIAALVLAVAVGCLVLVARRPVLELPAELRPAPPLRGRTVVVVTDAGSTRGVLIAEHADRITLAQAARVIGKGDDLPVDGHVHIPVAQIRLIQDECQYQVPRP